MRQTKYSGNSWIGEIPETWETLRLKDVGYLYGGLTGKAGDDFNVTEEDKFHYFVPFTNIFNNSYVDKNTLYKVKFSDNEVQNCVSKGDILFLMSSEDFDGVGKSSLVPFQLENLHLNSFCKGLRITKSGVDSNYINYLMSIKPIREIIRSLSNGFIRINLKMDKLNMCPIFLPSYKEQLLISSFLDEKCSEIDALISLQNDMIAKLQEYKQSVITEAVTRGLDPNVPMKDSGIEWIGMVPEHWSVVPLLKSVWARGRLGWKGLKAEEYVASGYPFLSAFNIIDNKIAWTNLNFINQERFEESPEIKLSVGDVLVVKDGAGIGKCARIDSLDLGEATVNSSLCVMSPYKTLNYKFLHYYFLSNTFQNLVLLLKNGMGVPHLTQENMKNIILTSAPIDEQIQIADFLDRKCAEIDALIDIKKQKIETLKEYKKSLIYECVTGKKEIA